MKGKICLILVALFCVVTASTAVARRGGHKGIGHGRGPGLGKIMHIADKLDLTDDQLIALRKHMRNIRKDVHPLVQQAGAFQKQVVKLMNNDTFDEEQVKAVIKLESEIMCELNLRLLKAMHEFRKNLTPEQIEEVTELIENHKGPEGHEKGME